MITYLKCSEVSIDKVYEAFSIGFSDYIIKIPMSKDMLVERFFGPEGNNLDTSFIALDGERAIGVIFGGIKNYEEIKTMRCGTMAIDPEYRGKGISQELMRLHREEAIRQGCKQMFLEVIVGNDRAINLYKKLGYEKVYDLFYFSLENTGIFKENYAESGAVREVTMEELKNFAAKNLATHINWQNDMECIEKLREQKHYGVFENNELAAAVSANKNGKINFLYVKKENRGNNMGKRLLCKAVKELKLEKLSLGFPNNSSIIGFLKHMGFNRDNISQYEMYITL